MASRLTIKVSAPHETDVYTEVAVVGGAVETQVDAERDGRPGGVLGTAVEADLIGFGALQTLEDA